MGRYTLVLVAAVAVLLLVPACGKQQGAQEAAGKGGTAKGDLKIARSALSTTAPDAKLLVVQTAETVTATGTPTWAFLLGSPSTDKTYIVYVSKGQVMAAQEYGKAGLPKGEWSSVPATADWKVDSDAALSKATAASNIKNPTSYDMGMLMHVPASEAATATTKTFTWYVSLASSTGTAGVLVDARTGKVTKE